MATMANPLQQQKQATGPGTAGSPSTMDMLIGGLPAVSSSGAGQNALGMMLGPGTNLNPYLQIGGVGYGEQLDDMEMNPMLAWY